MEIEGARKALRKVGFDEIHQVTTFVCYRESKGEQQRILVELFDLGDEQTHLGAVLGRYSCKANTEDGKFAYGNSAPSPSAAIEIVHWNDLDK